MFVRTIALLICLVLALPVGAQTSEGEATKEACVPCQGAGKVEVSCPACVGSKKVACPSCTGFTLNPAQRRNLAVNWEKLTADGKGFTPTPEVRLAIVEALQESVQGLLARKPGQLVCRGCSLFHDKDKGCRSCKDKRFAKCKGCKGKGEVNCVSCSRKGRVTQICHACDGSGEVPALGDWKAPADSKESDHLDCLWCSGWGLEDCRNCTNTGRTDQKCTSCQGAKKTVCRECHGFKKPACLACRGIGKVRNFLDPNGGTSNCKVCKGKGVGKCTLCKGGFLQCQTCKGKGKGRLSCLHCRESQELPCAGCSFGSTFSWEEFAERCIGAGQSARAKHALQSGLAHKERELRLHEERLAEDIEHYQSTVYAPKGEQAGSGSNGGSEGEEKGDDDELILIEYPNVKQAQWEIIKPDLERQLEALRSVRRAEVAALKAKMEAIQ